MVVVDATMRESCRGSLRDVGLAAVTPARSFVLRDQKAEIGAQQDPSRGAGHEMNAELIGKRSVRLGARPDERDRREERDEAVLQRTAADPSLRFQRRRRSKPTRTAPSAPNAPAPVLLQPPPPPPLSSPTPFVNRTIW